MKYLLDTCALIYMVFDPDSLSPKAVEIAEGDNDLYVSIASIWEIMIKEQIGNLDIDETSAMELQRICGEMDISILQTTIPQLDGIRHLPAFKDHGDPFDRLIISQAMDLGLPVLTSDRKFKRYNIEIVW
jgi:PIN domain nuclease of toxin-antitoxin system